MHEKVFFSVTDSNFTEICPPNSHCVPDGPGKKVHVYTCMIVVCARLGLYRTHTSLTLVPMMYKETTKKINFTITWPRHMMEVTVNMQYLLSHLYVVIVGVLSWILIYIHWIVVDYYKSCISDQLFQTANTL